MAKPLITITTNDDGNVVTMRNSDDIVMTLKLLGAAMLSCAEHHERKVQADRVVDAQSIEMGRGMRASMEPHPPTMQENADG